MLLCPPTPPPSLLLLLLLLLLQLLPAGRGPAEPDAACQGPGGGRPCLGRPGRGGTESARQNQPGTRPPAPLLPAGPGHAPAPPRHHPAGGSGQVRSG